MPSAGGAEAKRQKRDKTRFLTHLLSRAGGRIAHLPLPRVLRPWVWGTLGKMMGIDLSRVPHPLTLYPNFSSFFTRPLPQGLLSFPKEKEIIASPVSGVFLSRFILEGEQVVPIKGNPHSLVELLGSQERMARFLGGEGYILYLRPCDYHRIHAFHDLTLYTCELYPGSLLPVNRLGQKVPGIFGRNERWLMEGEFHSHPFLMIWVGALFVGSLRFLHPHLIPFAPTLKKPVQRFRVELKRGEEMGCFAFGSTVILILSRPTTPLLPIKSIVTVGTPWLRIL